MWKKLINYIYNFEINSFISKVFRYFSFPSIEKETGFFLTKVDKCKFFDTYFIEVKDKAYNYSFIEDFSEAGILEIILDKYDQEGLERFKCIFLLETTDENSIWITESLSANFTPNDPKTLIEAAKNKFVKKLDYYESMDFEIKTVIIKILLVDRHFVDKREDNFSVSESYKKK